MLDDLLVKEYKHETGQLLPILATCIDSAGHRTQMVYDYVGRQAARRVYAIIGRDGDRVIVSNPSKRNWGLNRRKVPLYTVGVDAAKSLWVSRYRVTEKGPGYVHVPLKDWDIEEMAAQLTSERLVVKFQRGFPKQVWIATRPRNEAFDCVVYALAALRLIHPNLEIAGQLLRNPASAPKAAPKRAPWIDPSRGRGLGGKGWLK